MTPKKILLSICTTLSLCSSVYAQTESVARQKVSTNLADNNSRNITPAKLREAIEGVIDYTATTKVDKIQGKGLSTHDFTADLKAKLDGIASGATISPWSIGSGTAYYTAGNVGIGTSAPTSKLHVVGNRITVQSSNPTVHLKNSITGTEINALELSDENVALIANRAIEVNPFGGSTTMYIQNNDGNVGIGVPNPQFKLSVRGDIGLDEEGTTSLFGILNSKASIADISNVDNTRDMDKPVSVPTQYALTFKANSANPRFTGNVGIGTVNPTAPLDVNGNINTESFLLLNSGAFARWDGNFNRVYNRNAIPVLSFGANDNYYDANENHFFRGAGGSNILTVSQSNSMLYSYATKHLFGGQSDDGTFAQFAGDVKIKTSLKVNNSIYALNGDYGTTFTSNQLLFGLQSTSNYCHAIRTRHDGGQPNANALDFYVWKVGDQPSTIAGQHSVTITGIGLGVKTIAPQASLHIIGDGFGDVLRFKTNQPGVGDWVINPFIMGISNGGLSFLNKVASTTPLVISASDNIGIGTNSPISKLQITNGDIEVETINTGLILKAPNGTRYRITVSNTGTLSTTAL